jgi:predicted nuclease of predicted toxin-antitoxin system
MSCRILLDENLSPIVASILQAAGHDVLTIQGAGLLSAPDHQILSLAATENRVIVSGDLRDFNSLIRERIADDRTFPGVVLVSLKNPVSPSTLARRIEQQIIPDPDRLQNSLAWLPLLQ